MVANIGETIRKMEQKQIRKDLADFRVGDTVRMKVKVQEADKMRLHPFEGVVIRKTGKGLKGTFTVRKISFGEGVERIFPIHSPVIDSLKVISKGLVKRARLYHLREDSTKKSRVKKEQAQGTKTTAPRTTPTETAPVA